MLSRSGLRRERAPGPSSLESPDARRAGPPADGRRAARRGRGLHAAVRARSRCSPSRTSGRAAPLGLAHAGRRHAPRAGGLHALDLGLPRRPLLTLAAGVAWTGQDEPPGWYQLAVKVDGRVARRAHAQPARAARLARRQRAARRRRARAATLALRAAPHRPRRRGPSPSPPGWCSASPSRWSTTSTTTAARSGIVLVSIDTLRRDHVGAYGYARPTTPRLDALAREGLLAGGRGEHVVVDAARAPVDADRRVDPGRARRRGHASTASTAACPRCPTLLRGAGYATQAVTSHLYVSGVYGLDHGFDHLDFHQDRKATDVADRAIDLARPLRRPAVLPLPALLRPALALRPAAGRRCALFEQPYTGTITGRWQDFSKRDAREPSRRPTSRTCSPSTTARSATPTTSWAACSTTCAARGLDALHAGAWSPPTTARSSWSTARGSTRRRCTRR